MKTYASIALLLLSFFLIHCNDEFPDSYEQSREVPVTDAVATIIVNSLDPPENSLIDKNTGIYYDLDYDIQNYDPANTYSLEAYLYDSNSGWPYTVFWGKVLPGPSGHFAGKISGYKFFNCYTIFTEICHRKTSLPFKLYFHIKEDTPDWSFSIGKTDYILFNEL